MHGNKQAQRGCIISLSIYLSLGQLLPGYCVQLWFPKFKTDVDKLETVQRQIRRTNMGLGNWPSVKGQKLSLFSASKKRLWSDLITD